MGPKLEDFEVITTIGRGSHGTVRKVRRKYDNLVMVWKELHYASMNPAEKQGLVLEVNLLRELHHPNIVRFYGHFVERQTGMLYIFMEYCAGGDLQKIIQKCKKTGTYLEEGFIWRVLKQVCEALRACHDKHTKGGEIILHRDIKPANVFLDKEANIKVGDFGLARTLNSDGSLARTFVGTPYYMSPEVIDGRNYNEQSDMWSLGCLIYELCSLQPPFIASTQRELCSKIKAGKFVRIPTHYSNDLWVIIREMLTLEDFLRPTSFLLLYNQTLKKKTVEEHDENKLLSDSLIRSLNRDSQKKEGSLHEEESSSFDSLENTVKERVKSEEEKRMEESLMKEVEIMLKESQQRKEKERKERLKCKELKIDVLQSSEDELDNVKIKIDKLDNDDPGSKELHQLIEKEVSPPKCVCGGTTLEEWKKRLNLVRSSEAALRQREMDIEEKEKEMMKREHRVQSMEQEAKQHLLRAQIYLKQTRTKNFSRFPHTKSIVEENLSDFDATTVSADLGYDDKPTVAYIDTQPENNPFLKMREKKQSAISKAHTELKRSNTLDNPKSRRKQGHSFYLDKGNGIPNVDKKDFRLSSFEQDFQNKIDLTKLKKEQDKKKTENFRIGPIENKKEISKGKNHTIKENGNRNNSRTVFNTFRQNWTKHTTGKENIEIKKKNPKVTSADRERKPLQVLRDSDPKLCNSKFKKEQETNTKINMTNHKIVTGYLNEKILRLYNAI